MGNRADMFRAKLLADGRADAAGVLLRSYGPKILLVKSPYKVYWDLPGGMVEPGETPPQAAEREVYEELGITLGTGLRLLVADYLNGTPNRRHGVRWVFDGGTMPTSGPLRLQAEEIEEARWVTRDEARQLTSAAPMLQRRIQAAIAAVYAANEVLLIDGWPRQVVTARARTGLLERLPLTTS